MPSADQAFDAVFSSLTTVPPQSQSPLSLWSKLGQTWPAQLAKDVAGGLGMFGQAAAGQMPVTAGLRREHLTDVPGSEQPVDPYVKGMADVAGMVTGGSYAAPAMKDAAGMGIKAYHGSPHDFDKFDISKIGTGEGAQAYGHGLYFAENPKVAREYEGMLAKNGYDPAVIARDALIAGDRDSAVKSLTGLARANEHIDPIYAGSVQKALELVQSGNPLPLPAKGRMYEVDINAKPEQFLDWDKPIRDQPVLDAVRNQVPDFLRKNFDYNAERGVSGSNAYHNFYDPNKGGLAGATQSLRQAGIPGIKYLDQGSRASGDGSRNYVVFDDKLVNILRKYGLAGASLLPAMGAGSDRAEAKPDFGAKMESELQSILAP